ncbi:MAG TPA: VWA domain-containing protein, partial [Blastocatellia bacterium]|nr:VWA domain-containing protein [Blastocatellia bacterium]
THFAIGTSSKPAAYLNSQPSGNDKQADQRIVTPPAAEGRHIVLAVDDYHLAAENLIAAKRALAKFVTQDLASTDQVALTVTSGTIGLYQQFTRDRSVIERAINRLSLQNRTSNGFGGIPNISDYQAELIEEGDAGALQIALEELRLRQGKPMRGGDTIRRPSNPRDSEEGVVRAKARNIVMENDRYTAITLGSLEAAIRGLQQLPGRKILILLSDGFFTGIGRTFTAYDLRRLTDAATRAGVVIYSVDARGLVAKPTLGSASDPQNATITQNPDARRRIVQGEIGAKLEGLYTIAKDTGGLPFFNSNDLGAGLKRVLDDTDAYYILGYEPTNSTRDGRFRKIEVRVASRPGNTIQTRAGYFAPIESTADSAGRKKEKTAKNSTKEAMDAKLGRYRLALTSLTPLHGIPLDLTAHFIHTPTNGSLALITAQIDSTGVDLDTGLEVVGVVLDENGKTVNNFSHSFELKRRETTSSEPQQRILNYHNLVQLPTGTYNVRLAVADGEMKQIGSAFDWVEIPDVKQKSLVLSSLILAEVGNDLAEIYDGFAALLHSNGANASYPLQPIHRFQRGGNLDFMLIAYNLQTNAQSGAGVIIQIKVLKGGKTVYAAPPGEMSLTAEQIYEGYPCVARLPLLAYDPGEYELRVEVADQISKQISTRSITFTIE